jgi:hypothetical protein
MWALKNLIYDCAPERKYNVVSYFPHEGLCLANNPNSWDSVLRWLFIIEPTVAEVYSPLVFSIKHNKDTLYMPPYVYAFFLWNQRLRLLNF